ncbi:MAG: hypothetical protein M3347_06105, partial [Armatimonadota bacterium]|nr:hypothetical protein [Armatimonadota bacterium]
TPGHRNWYTNGNIELGEAELLYLTWKATGEAEYRDLFELQWHFMMAPPQERWKGFGLRYSKEPAKDDGSDGAGYLAEKGSGEPGFDGNYTQVQLDMASRLYVESRDPRVLRLVHLLLNQLLPRIENENDWTLDMTGGSRQSYKGRFLSPGLAVAAWLGNRPDLATKVSSQFKVIDREYRAAAKQNWNHPNFYRGLGMAVAVILQAAQDAHSQAAI